MRNVGTALLLAISLFTTPVLVMAEMQTFQGRSEYTMEDNETMGEAQDIAYREALRSIAQEAGVYISSHSISVDGQISVDEAEMMAEAIVKVKSKEFQRTITPDGKVKIVALLTAELDMDKADALLREKAEEHQAEKQHREANEAYAEAQQQNKKLEEQYLAASAAALRDVFRQGDEAREKGDLDTALACFEKAVAAKNDYAPAYAKRGRIYWLQGNADKAMKDFEKALALDAKEAGAHYGKAVLLDRRGDKAEAVKEYRAFMEYADVDEYDKEIVEALDRILALDNKN